MAAVIGKSKHAKELWDWWHSVNESDWESTATPNDNWFRIGTGGQRAAFLHIPSNVVYKVQHTHRWDDTGYSSIAELKNARILNKQASNNDGWWGAYVRIPKVSGFKMREPSGAPRTVIAMEYVVGKSGNSASPRARDELRRTGLSDMHTANFIVDKDGSVWPIDMGCSMNSY